MTYSKSDFIKINGLPILVETTPLYFISFSSCGLEAIQPIIFIEAFRWLIA